MESGKSPFDQTKLEPKLLTTVNGTENSNTAVLRNEIMYVVLCSLDSLTT